MRQRMEPERLGGALLVRDIDLARRIVADQHDRETRHDARALDRRREPGREPGRESLAVDDRRHAGVTTESSQAAAASASSRGLSAAGLPTMCSRLSREAAPETMVIARFGTPSSAASALITAALAAPSAA